MHICQHEFAPAPFQYLFFSFPRALYSSSCFSSLSTLISTPHLVALLVLPVLPTRFTRSERHAPPCFIIFLHHSSHKEIDTLVVMFSLFAGTPSSPSTNSANRCEPMPAPTQSFVDEKAPFIDDEQYHMSSKSSQDAWQPIQDDDDEEARTHCALQRTMDRLCVPTT